MTAVSAQLPRSSDSVAAARRLVDTHTSGLSAPRREDAALMASELVANALRHGRGPVTIRIASEAGTLTIEVSDEGKGTVAIVPVPGPAGGWGLRIVQELADEWGVQSGSTRVWFRMSHGPSLPAVVEDDATT